MDEWQVLVQDVFHLTGRAQPVLTGHVEKGVVYIGDWFRTADGRLGQVTSIEFMCGPEVPDDALAITTDIDLSAGDVLTAHEPMAG